MRDYEEKTGAQNGIIIANISSFTLLLSAVLILGALCRFLKTCWKKVRRKPKRKHDVIQFQPITMPLRKCTSTPQLRTFSDYLEGGELPFDTEQVAVQPRMSPSLQPPMISRTVSSMDSRALEMSTPPGLLSRKSLPIWRSGDEIWPGELEPSLYKKEAALQKFQENCDGKSGTIDIEVFFDMKTKRLKVKVVNVRQMIKRGHMPATNTYVSIKKLPDRDVQRTSLHTQSKNPDFNNLFTFQVQPGDDITSHVLIFEVHHVDRFSTSVSRGIAKLPLFQVDVRSHRSLTIPFSTVQRSFLSSFYPAYRSSVSGSLFLTMKYLSENKVIVVNPVKVCNLSRKRHAAHDKDVYLKVVLRHRGEKMVKHKTNKRLLKKMSRSTSFYEVTFNETFDLHVGDSFPADESEIIISLSHYLFLKSSFILGQVRISRREPGYHSTHLQAILDSPDEAISTWYEMRCFVTSSPGAE